MYTKISMFKNSLLLFFLTQCRRLVMSLLLQRPVFNHRSVHVRFMFNRVSLNTLVIPCQYLPAVLHIHTSFFYIQMNQPTRCSNFSGLSLVV